MNTWEQFGELHNLCDLNIMGAYKDESCWDKAYQCMMSIIYDNRKTNPNYGLTLANLEEETEDE